MIPKTCLHVLFISYSFRIICNLNFMLLNSTKSLFKFHSINYSPLSLRSTMGQNQHFLTLKGILLILIVSFVFNGKNYLSNTNKFNTISCLVPKIKIFNLGVINPTHVMMMRQKIMLFDSF